MNDRRRARRAKQARRNGRRAKKRTTESSADWTLRDAIRSVLGGHPLGLLSMACVMVDAAIPERVLEMFDGVRTREMTALLAVTAELLVDEPATQLECRREVAERNEHLPRWIAALPRADAYRAVRITDAYRDFDQLVIGMRIGQHELTVVVTLDHLLWSRITDTEAVHEPIGEVLAHVIESRTDIDVFEMTLADARAWIADVLDKSTFAPKSETWPLYKPLVRWALDRLPDGGEHRPPVTDWESNEELCDKFFATSSAAPFTESEHRELLHEFFETGSVDPLRWSPARVHQAIGDTPYREHSMPLEVALDAPDLLRAYIPYAHAQCGIRDELTSRTLARVDALRLRYKRLLLREYEDEYLDDAV
ncbi:hypothetical protein [Mycobacterium sp. 3519A]|uniref:hypothetical protein n=1 Tax=Mycobacterium sp. 3519A TaxID=2057184 RepID=UPI000C797F57|nr:hypothetical protein [Mycobacterium sp. 3519A]